MTDFELRISGVRSNRSTNWATTTAQNFFPLPLFLSLFSSFQTNTTIPMQQLHPSSIECRDSNPQPSECESHPINTRPGLPPKPLPKLSYFLFASKSFLRMWRTHEKAILIANYLAPTVNLFTLHYFQSPRSSFCDSVTRFGEISPLRRYFKSIWLILLRSLKYVAKFSTYIGNDFAIGQIFVVVIAKYWTKKSNHLVTLQSCTF